MTARSSQMKARLAHFIGIGLAIGLASCGDESADPNMVARAGEYRLTVDDVVSLLADEESLPPQAAVVESLANLWVDYTLLTDALAEDSALTELDFGTFVRQQLEVEMVSQLRDSVIQVDTFITPDELRDLYAAEAPDVEFRARHVMLTLPFEPTEAQRDSVRRVLEGLAAQIESGAARFEDVARRYSQDAGSAQSGGDLGFFARGDMVQPFEDAVLALEPGEISPVVETPMGLHLIRLEERVTRALDEIAPEFRARMQERRTAVAESTYVVGLEGPSPPRVTEGAFAVARELARNPQTRLSGRAARRPLVEWDGGAYEAGELQELLRFEQPVVREQVEVGADEELDAFLRGLARRKLLVAEARRSGLEPASERVDSLTELVREQLLDAARALGLQDLDQAPGEDRRVAIARTVRQALADNLAGATRVVPLGQVGFQLREGVPVVISSDGVGRSVLGIAEVRASRGLSPIEESFDTAGSAGDSTTALPTGSNP